MDVVNAVFVGVKQRGALMFSAVLVTVSDPVFDITHPPVKPADDRRQP